MSTYSKGLKAVAHKGVRVVRILLARLIGGIMIAFATVFSVLNYSALTGSTSPLINSLPLLLVVAGLVGAGQALWIKAKRPDDYDRIGNTVMV